MVKAFSFSLFILIALIYIKIRRKLWKIPRNRLTIQLAINGHHFVEKFDEKKFCDSFAEGGFIEKFCISDEQKVLVRNERKIRRNAINKR